MLRSALPVCPVFCAANCSAYRQAADGSAPVANRTSHAVRTTSRRIKEARDRRALGIARIIVLALLSLTLGLSGTATADPTPPKTKAKTRHFETYGGIDAGGTHWLAYSGLTLAPFSDMHRDGIRLRFSGGYGGYSYKASRDIAGKVTVADYQVTTHYAEALIGYQFKAWNLTTKALAGLAQIDHQIAPTDLGNRVKGPATGFKAALELWLDISPDWYGSLDLTYAEAHETRSARLRIGHRFKKELSAGLEARLNQDAQSDFKMSEAEKAAFRQEPLDYAWIGAFGRYEWSTGEVSASAGLNMSDLETSAAFVGTDDLGFYATLNLLNRF